MYAASYTCPFDTSPAHLSPTHSMASLCTTRPAAVAVRHGGYCGCGGATRRILPRYAKILPRYSQNECVGTTNECIGTHRMGAKTLPRYAHPYPSLCAHLPLSHALSRTQAADWCKVSRPVAIKLSRPVAIKLSTRDQ